MVPLGRDDHVHPSLGSELVTRFNLYPAATITGIATPRYSSGQALNMMEGIGRRYCRRE